MLAKAELKRLDEKAPTRPPGAVARAASFKRLTTSSTSNPTFKVLHDALG